MKDHLTNKIDQKIVINSQFFSLQKKKFLYFFKQNMFVDVHKKSFDIKLENIGITTTILRARTKKMIYSLDAEMRSFFQSATIAIVDKITIKKFVDIIVNQVMNYSITKVSSKNFPLDWILNNEAYTRTNDIMSIH